VTGARGDAKEVGEYALHVQSAWRIISNDRIVAGSSDLHDKQQANSDYLNLPVRTVEVHHAGSFAIHLEKNFTLKVFPDDSSVDEHWRLLKPYTDHPHLLCNRQPSCEWWTFATLGVLAALFVTAMLLMNRKPSISELSAQSFIDEFHQQYNTGRYSDIYGSADKYVQQRISRQKLEGQLQNVNDRVGIVRQSSCSERRRLSMKATQTFRCVTTFSKAAVVETFEIADEGGALKLREYAIAPTLPN
jgi:hypothetical protein